MSYQYDTLPHDGHIRLLSLHPADSYAEPIVCSIKTTRLEEAEYDALSYSWGMEDGRATLDHTIFIGDTSLLITENLFAGLKRIRSSTATRRLWIDAVCINQRDDAEKSTQVAMMAEIYSRADTTIVWLGEGDDREKDQAFLRVLRRVKDYVTRTEPLPGIQWNCLAVPILEEDVASCPGCVALRKTGTYDADTHDRWLRDGFAAGLLNAEAAEKTVYNITKFFSKRYWKRRWILQELHHAKAQQWYWGDCSWNLIDCPTHWLRDLRNAIGRIDGEMRMALEEPPIFEASGTSTQGFAYHEDVDHEHEALLRMDGLAKFCMPNSADVKNEVHWKNCLPDFMKSECFLTKDIYYAVTSIAKPQIRIDYSWTDTQVFTHFAKVMLSHGEWHWLFYAAAKTLNDPLDLPPGHAIVDGLPSWVPDPRAFNSYPRQRDGPPPMRILVSEHEDFLKCTVRCLGVVQHPTVIGFDIERNNVFWQLCITQPNAVEVDQAPTGLRGTFDFQYDRTRAQPGDLICSCLETLFDDDIWLVIRPRESFWHLVGIQEARYSIPRNADMDEQAAAFARCPILDVQIV